MAADGLAKHIGYTPLLGLHRRAVARAIESLLQQQHADGTWADDVRATMVAVLALHAIGFAVDHPVMGQALAAIDAAVEMRDGRRVVRVRRDTLWQTAQAVRALRAAETTTDDPA